MNGNNIIFPMATIQGIGTGGPSRTRDVLNIINMMFNNGNNGNNETILNQSMNDESPDNPVSESFVKNLDESEVTEEMIQKDVECSICLESFKTNDKCIKLPCLEYPHYFHCGDETKCLGIKPWLQKQNTCPVCRTEFPKEETDDERTPLLSESNHASTHNDGGEPENPDSPIQPMPLMPPMSPVSPMPPMPPMSPVSPMSPMSPSLTPDQVSGLNTNISNITPDITDNNIIEEQIINTIDSYLRRLGNEIIRNNIDVNTLNSTVTDEIDTDLQRAIELSLQENNTDDNDDNDDNDDE